MILVFRRPTHAAVGAAAQPPPFPLLARHFQPLLPPQPVDTLAVDPPALPSQQGPDPAVAVTRVLPHQLQDPRHQPHFLLGGLFRRLPLRRALLPQNTAGTTLGNTKAVLEEAHGLPPLGGRYHFFWATSWSICLSRANSATRRLRRAFSASSSLRRLASSSAILVAPAVQGLFADGQALADLGDGQALGEVSFGLPQLGDDLFSRVSFHGSSPGPTGSQRLS